MISMCKQMKRSGNKMILETEEVMDFLKNILIWILGVVLQSAY